MCHYHLLKYFSNDKCLNENTLNYLFNACLTLFSGENQIKGVMAHVALIRTFSLVGVLTLLDVPMLLAEDGARPLANTSIRALAADSTSDDNACQTKQLIKEPYMS